MRFSLYYMVLIAFFFSCKNRQTPRELNKKVQFEIGQTYQYNDDKLKLLTLDDSRCPLNTNCIWAGEVKLNFLLTHKTKETYFTLISDTKEQFQFHDYSLKLLDVTPYPSGDEIIDKNKYKVSVLIETNIP